MAFTPPTSHLFTIEIVRPGDLIVAFGEEELFNLRGGQLVKYPIKNISEGIIGIVGTALGFSSLCVILCISFLILAIFSLGYIVIRRVGRKARVPFYPFLGAGELLLMLLISCREVMK